MRAVNLLPSDLRSADRKVKAVAPGGPEGCGAGAYAILGALAAVVAATAVTALAVNDVQGQERALAAVQAQQQVAQVEASRLSPYGDFRQTALQRRQTVTQLATSRFEWERALRDLSRALPADVTLDLITGTVVPGAGTGGISSSNPLRAAIAAPAIELSGCTAGQSSVARIMARMRAVQGVTRVSLASSKKEEEAAAATGDSAGAETKRQGCGKGSPPKFQIVLFFEGIRTAPSAPATGAATTAATTAAASASPAPAATPAPGAASAPTATPAPGSGQPSAPTAPSGAAPGDSER